MKKILIIVSFILICVVCGMLCYLFNNKDNENLIDAEEIKTDWLYKNATYNKEENILDDDVLGILTIEKIGLSATVKEGSNNEVLKEFIGHIPNTSIYDGNIGLAAHNRGNKYSYFARINELEIGDIITYKTKFYTRQYKVDNIKVVLETDWSLLEYSQENKITMVTCVANRSNQRLCVQAIEI